MVSEAKIYFGTFGEVMGVGESWSVVLSCLVVSCWGEARRKIDGEGSVSVWALVARFGECLVSAW